MDDKKDKRRISNKRNWLLPLGLVLGALLLAVVVTSPKTPESTTFDKSSEEVSIIGQRAPDFSLLDQNGEAVTLADYSGKKLVLFFTEGQMCYPSCWNQIASLGNNPKLNNGDVATLTVVTDTRDMWDDPYQKKPEMLAERMVYDFSKVMSSAYDILYFPSSMHPGELPGHTYVVVDSDGVVRRIKDDPDMGINDSWLEEMVNQIQ